jgi:hypothetical protein
MTKDEEYKGFWFVPTNPEIKVPGILYFEANKEIRLELIGGFESEIQEILTNKSIEIIHGITHKSEKVSLLICNRYGSWNLSSEYPTTNYTCQYFILGKHLSTISELVFDRIEVDFTSLYEWYPSGRIQHEISFTNKNKLTETNFKISDSDYWEDVINIDNEYQIRIYGAAGFTSSVDQREFNLTQNTFFEVNTINSKRSFIDLFNKVGIFRQFLSLAALSSVDFLQITLFDNDDYQEFENGERLIHSIPLYFIEEKQKFDKPQRHQFLFKHTDISHIFPQIIKKWYGDKQNLAPIRNHLISSVKTKKVFTSLDFLIIVQALEGYHRRFIHKKDDKVLKTRLGELIDLFKGINKITNNPINITHVVSSRNYYSHFFDRNKNVLDGVKLFYLTNQLRNLLICCVLRLLGFDIGLTNKLLNENEKL